MSMRTLRLLVVLLLPSCLMVLAAPAPPAAACSCASGQVADFAEWADTVFVGTLDEAVLPPQEPVFSSVDPVTYVFDVSVVFEGQAHESTHVGSVRSGASCGLEGLVPGQDYVVFAGHKTVDGEPSETLWAGLCGGTAPAGRGLVADVENVLGPGSPPQPGELPARSLLAPVGSSLLALAHAVVSAVLSSLTSAGWTPG